MSNKTGLRIVVIGSNQFDDKSFVFGFLDNLKQQYAQNYDNHMIESLYSSDFTGVSAFVQEWAQSNHIDFHTHHFFSNNKVKTNPFFENNKLPPVVLAHDKFYQEGKDFLMSEQIDMVITMPNATGKLGVQTENILRMAELVSSQNPKLMVLNAQELYAQILEVRDEENLRKSTQQPRTNQVTNLGQMNKF